MTQANNKSTSPNYQEAGGGSVSALESGDKAKLPRLSALARGIAQGWVPCLIVFASAFGFNLYRLGSPSVWFDEAFSVELARQPLPLLWHIIFSLEPNMELYYLFLHGWLGFISLFGLHATEIVVRFPSAIFAALSTVVIFLLGWRFLGLTAGILGAGLYLLNDLQLVYAQQTRSYSLQLLLICLAWYALFAIFTGEPKKRWWVCFIVATTLAIYAHLFSLVILLAQLVTLGGLLLCSSEWRLKVCQQWFALVISLVSIGLLSIPMLLVSTQGAKTGWLAVPHLSDIYHLFLTISGDSKIYLLIIAAWCASGLLVVALAQFPPGVELLDRFGLTGGTDEKRPVQLQQLLPAAFALVCWLVVPIVFSYVVSQGSIRLFSSRYLVTIVPPLLLLVGLGVMVLCWRMVRVVVILGLFLLALFYVPVYYRSAQVEDWNSTSHWLEQYYQTGDGLVCYDNALGQGCQVSVEYYLHAYPSAAHFTADSPGAFSWTTFSSPHPDAAVDPAMLASYGGKHPRVFFIVGRLPDDAAAAKAKVAQQWLDRHYRCIAQIVTRTVTIRLYVTGALST